MIRIHRCPEPAILVKNKNTWTEALLTAETSATRKSAASKYRHHSIKNALVTLFKGKCAYCESAILQIDYGDIEHFRPKSAQRFRHLTFEWNNLFLACKKCNGRNGKSDYFPDTDEGGPPVNPCDDEPGEHFTFSFDRKARLANVSPSSERGRVTVDLFGLNRPDLRTRRSAFVEKIFVLALLAHKSQDAASLFDQSQSDQEEYSAFAREIAHQMRARE